MNHGNDVSGIHEKLAVIKHAVSFSQNEHKCFFFRVVGLRYSKPEWILAITELSICRDMDRLLVGDDPSLL